MKADTSTIRLLLTGLLAAAIFLPAIQWWETARILDLRAATEALPAGQVFFISAKLFGMLAITFTVLQIALSLSARLGARVITRADHAMIGACLTVFLILHVVSFVTAVSLRNGHIAWPLLVPNMTHGSYNRGVGLGVIGFYLMVFGAMVPIWRFRPRILHRAAAVGGVLGLIHALWIGSEKAYIIGVAVVSFALVIYTIGMQAKRRAVT